MQTLARIVLSSEIPDYFLAVGVGQSSAEIHIHLDELTDSGLSDAPHIESKGRMEVRKVTDFPANLEVVADGMRYYEEFGVFCKKRMETHPVTCRMLEESYHIDGDKRYVAGKITLCLSDSMRRIVRAAFPMPGRSLF